MADIKPHETETNTNTHVEELKYRKLLYEYFEKEILQHDEDQKMQTQACLVVEGLRTGQKIANKNNPTNGKYTYKQVYCATVFSKNSILQSYRGKNFRDEKAKVSYAAAIIRNNLNTVVDNLKEKEKSEEKIKALKIDNLEHETAEYVKKSKDVIDETLEGLW